MNTYQFAVTFFDEADDGEILYREIFDIEAVNREDAGDLLESEVDDYILTFTEKDPYDVEWDYDYNSIAIVDRDEDGKPYLELIKINQVYAIGSCKGNVIDWVAVQKCKSEVVIFDDLYFWLVDIEKNSISEPVPHGNTRCPAEFVYNDNLRSDNNIIKKNPITASLGKLDDLLNYHVSKKHTDLYTLYPIFETIASDCNYPFVPVQPPGRWWVAGHDSPGVNQRNMTTATTDRCEQPLAKKIRRETPGLLLE